MHPLSLPVHDCYCMIGSLGAQLPTPSEQRMAFDELKSCHGQESPRCNIGSSEQIIVATPNKEHQIVHKWRLRMKKNCWRDG